MANLYYARVSTAEQNEARQIEAAHALCVDPDFIYLDKLSGKDQNRPRLQAMLQECRKGDTLYCESFSRLARNTRDLLDITEKLDAKGVKFISQKEAVDTSTPAGRFMLTVFAALAELERENILQRQAEGIAIAKAEGKYTGRQPIKVNEAEFRAVCARWRGGELTATRAMELLNLKPNTFYRRVKEMGL